MKKSASIASMVLAGGLVLAGCSGPSGSGPAATSAGASQPAAVADGQSTVLASSFSTDGDHRLITAQAVGTVTGTPDVLTVSLGVETRSDSAGTALAENNRLAGDVIAVIKANGVAPEDLQTSQLSINPTFDDGGRVTGYQVTNMVTATLLDISTAGALIDAVGAAAGDAIRVQQLSFSIDDDSALRAAARADAVKRAQAQAQQLAEAAGVPLGAIRSITEIAGSGPLPYPSAYDTTAATASVPIEAGSQELTVAVQVVYEIG